MEKPRIILRTAQRPKISLLKAKIPDATPALNNAIIPNFLIDKPSISKFKDLITAVVDFIKSYTGDDEQREVIIADLKHLVADLRREENPVGLAISPSLSLSSPLLFY